MDEQLLKSAAENPAVYVPRLSAPPSRVCAYVAGRKPSALDSLIISQPRVAGPKLQFAKVEKNDN